MNPPGDQKKTSGKLQVIPSSKESMASSISGGNVGCANSAMRVRKDWRETMDSRTSFPLVPPLYTFSSIHLACCAPAAAEIVHHSLLVLASALTLTKSMSNTASSPRLPPELEKEIFTLSLRQQNTDAQNLLLVAKRFFDWLIPIYYEVVMITRYKDSGKWPPGIEAERLKQYGHHVRHFLILDKKSDVKLLSHCPNVFNLAMRAVIPESEMETILGLPVTRLSIKITPFFQETPQCLAFVSRITHLDLVIPTQWEPKDVLPHFHVLTHLASFPNLTKPCDFFLYVKTLEVILLIGGGGAYQPDGSYLAVKAQDGDNWRIVQLLIAHLNTRDWVEGAWGREDMWALVDEVIEQRRKQRNLGYETGSK
ncbi:hypothetical protein BDN72DRAFT_916722 [Pluteus cervinus]|uniref:Uncharacterized protein n=1 Tax=Pluteus cervinus TaxID=181527 RepID=A0ACD2ZXQ4_9AGAR|nr:hypothetical protein BDN72DRAFT_916722 [Pluteus cervinus]